MNEDEVLTDNDTSDGRPFYQVEVLGLDIFRPHELETESIHADNLPCWMRDTDCNVMGFILRQVFYSKTSAWDKLQMSFKASFVNDQPIHVVAAQDADADRCIVVTAYFPDDSLWTDGYTKRRS